MEFEYAYHGSSAVKHQGEGTQMSFAPDTLREPTFFRGDLKASVAFREAMGALHDVVISDHRYKPKDKSAYKAWLATQDFLDWSSIASERRGAQEELQRVQAEIREIEERKRRRMRSFESAKQRYFDYIYKRDRPAWYILDPVITVHPDELFLECFSKDESTYARLGVNYNVFDRMEEFACGTTNIDYSEPLYNEFQKIRSYKKTAFQIDPSGFEVKTEREESFKEVKIDLPDTWIRGFLQVNSAMSLPMTSFDLHPMDLYNICFVLRRNREIRGPRAIRYVLEPGRPVKIVFEPWGKEMVCHRSIYKGDKAEEIRVWGRRRIHTLERLIPVARKFTVHLLGKGMPSFYIADLGDMSFTLGLSGWTANDWSRQGSFDLMAPRQEVDLLTQRRVFQALKQDWFSTPDRLSENLALDRATVLGALGAWTQAGRAIFDLNRGVYRARELSREPLPMERFRFSSPREEAAHKILAEGDVDLYSSNSPSEGRVRLEGNVLDGSQMYSSSLTLDGDERMVAAECNCYWHRQNKLRKGPCEHILALRLKHRREVQERTGRVR